ncbi:MAG: hypothetical protein KA275_06200, partial [Chitinophagaceae bacterium]|nr:hypothetical protein [Chitinophagaceae bacterium]
MKIKPILIIILSIITSNSSVYAQQFYYKPDTVKQFKIYGVDTLPNFLERTTVYNFEKDNSIKSKEEYIWNPMELKFRYINNFRFAKYPNEIIATEFIIDNNNIEKEKYKTSYLLNKSKKIKEINQKYSQGNETKLWRSTLY